MSQHEKINYLELPSKDLNKSKQFFAALFDWEFTDYGTEYTAFADSAGLEGGFYLSEHVALAAKGSVLVVFYSDDLLATQRKVEQAGGVISQAIFSFPGGSRFHFLDPNGNEYAVWSVS